MNRILSCSHRYSSLVISCAICAVCCSVAFLCAYNLCGGEFIYPIDDTYIHIAMAKTLATQGVWGVEPEKLAFCSSSPLWTILLATFYLVFGVSDLLPWFLALGFNIASLILFDRIVMGMSGNWRWRVGGALAIAVAGPFICTTALGMEHAMHGFFILASIATCSCVISDKNLLGGKIRPMILAATCAAAATASRYESLFLLLPLGVGLCGLELWMRVKAKTRMFPIRALCFLAAAGAPVIVYGLWAVIMGGHFLPNSLLLKGQFRTLPELFDAIIQILGSVKPGCGFLYLLGLALVSSAILPRVPVYWRIASFSVAIAIGGHLVFADVGQLCRYEAYLTSTGMGCLVLCALCFVRSAQDKAHKIHLMGIYAGMGIVAIVFINRSYEYAIITPWASQNIRNQQVLMTRIMSEMPEEDQGCVALNDLGYMALHGGFPFLDIWGLGSQDAAECILKHRGTWSKEDHEFLFKKHDVKYVVVFKSWFHLWLMPEGTLDVAELKLLNNLVCGGDTVVFRATSQESAQKLRAHLLRYVDKMPPQATLTVW